MAIPAVSKPSKAFQRLYSDTTFITLKNTYNKALIDNDKLTAAICLRRMGKICFQLTNFPQALEYHLRAGKLLREQNQDLMRAENLNDIGEVFQMYKQTELAKQHFDEAFAIYKAWANHAGIAFTHGKVGQWHMSQHHYDSGFYYLRIALHEFLLLNDDKGIARVCGQIGNIYEDLERYDSARFYFQRSLKLSRQTRDTTTYIEAINNMGDVYRKTGNYKEALPLTQQALALSLRTNELYHLGSAYRDLAKTFHLMGDNDSAYFYQRTGQAYAQDLYWRENATQLAVLKTMYDLEMKNAEISRLQAVRKSVVAIVIIGILLLLMGILVISRQRLRIKNAQLLIEQEKQTSLARKVMMELQEQGLKQEIELKSRELSVHMLHIMQKNQFLEKLHHQFDEMLKEDRRDNRKQLKQLQLQISQNFNHDQQWEKFTGIFDQVHETFVQKLKQHCDTLTRSDLRLISLLKMNLGSEEIAAILGISNDSVRVMRYRVRKKLNLQQGENLELFIQSL
ncbi:MAG TPA: tetratricopeptide repeat protein [Niastella sp.]|nr:tetratricopeptide repeat protein [Niastella sp.]